MPGAALKAADLRNGEVLTTLLGEGNPITVEKSADSVCFIPAGNGEKACVVVADICAGESIVHIIDAVLIPASPAPSSE